MRINSIQLICRLSGDQTKDLLLIRKMANYYGHFPLWARIESNYLLLTYQVSVLPVNYVPPFAIFDMSNFICHQVIALTAELTAPKIKNNLRGYLIIYHKDVYIDKFARALVIDYKYLK